MYQYKVIQYLNMAGKSKSVMGAGEPEEIKSFPKFNRTLDKLKKVD